MGTILGQFDVSNSCLEHSNTPWFVIGFNNQSCSSKSQVE